MSSGASALGVIGTIAEQAKLPCDDFSPIAFAASALRFILLGSEATLEVHSPAFAQEPLARIGQPSERHDPMPFRPLLFRAVPVRKPLRSSQREIRGVSP